LTTARVAKIQEPFTSQEQTERSWYRQVPQDGVDGQETGRVTSEKRPKLDISSAHYRSIEPGQSFCTRQPHSANDKTLLVRTQPKFISS